MSVRGPLPRSLTLVRMEIGMPDNKAEPGSQRLFEGFPSTGHAGLFAHSWTHWDRLAAGLELPGLTRISPSRVLTRSLNTVMDRMEVHLDHQEELRLA